MKKVKVKVENIEYELIKDYRDGFDEQQFLERVTDYFYEFDYIFGDWAYGKLRLKGFYNKENKKVSNINNYDNIDDYIKNNCAFDCKYFVLEKVGKSEV